MLKIYLTGIIFVTSLASDSLAMNLPSTYRFIEVDEVRELSGLPPKLQAVITLTCHQRFVQIVRHESVDPKSGKTVIAIGAIVSEDNQIPCSTPPTSMEVPAGHGFSGRDYSTVLIKK